MIVGVRKKFLKINHCTSKTTLIIIASCDYSQNKAFQENYTFLTTACWVQVKNKIGINNIWTPHKSDILIL